MAGKTVGRVWHIYKITCLISGKSYIGLTSDSVEQRWSNHVCQATRHDSKSILHRAIRKYGRASFAAISLQRCASLEEASAAEIAAIAMHNTIDPIGYNLSAGGMGTTGVRRPHTKETRAKIASAHRGRVVSIETRRRQSAAKKGRKVSEITREKLKTAQKLESTRQRHAPRSARATSDESFHAEASPFLKHPSLAEARRQLDIEALSQKVHDGPRDLEWTESASTLEFLTQKRRRPRDMYLSFRDGLRN